MESMAWTRVADFALKISRFGLEMISKNLTENQLEIQEFLVFR